MNEMIERIARKLAAMNTPRRWEEQPEEIRGVYRILASGALEVLREPTAVMVRAGEAVECGASSGYRAMIDAALTDT